MGEITPKMKETRGTPWMAMETELFLNKGCTDGMPKLGGFTAKNAAVVRYRQVPALHGEASYGIYRLQRGLLATNVNHINKNAHVWKVVLPNFPSCRCPTLRASIAHLLITKHNPGDIFLMVLYILSPA